MLFVVLTFVTQVKVLKKQKRIVNEILKFTKGKFYG